MKPKTPFGRFLWYAGPMLLWMGVIFFNSTDHGSASNTRPIMNSILRRVLPGVANQLNPQQIERVDWNIRKVAHVSEYTLLSILAFRMVAWGNPRLCSYNILLPYLIGILYAGSDEWHQSFVPSRDGTAADVFFDNTGVLVGIVLCLWQHIIHNQRNQNQAIKS